MTQKVRDASWSAHDSVLVKGIEECFLGQVLVVFKFGKKQAKIWEHLEFFFVSNSIKLTSFVNF